MRADFQFFSAHISVDVIMFFPCVSHGSWYFRCGSPFFRVYNMVFSCLYYFGIPVSYWGLSHLYLILRDMTWVLIYGWMIAGLFGLFNFIANLFGWYSYVTL